MNLLQAAVPNPRGPPPGFENVGSRLVDVRFIVSIYFIQVKPSHAKVATPGPSRPNCGHKAGSGPGSMSKTGQYSLCPQVLGRTWGIVTAIPISSSLIMLKPWKWLDEAFLDRPDAWILEDRAMPGQDRYVIIMATCEYFAKHTFRMCNKLCAVDLYGHLHSQNVAQRPQKWCTETIIFSAAPVNVCQRQWQWHGSCLRHSIIIVPLVHL